MVPYSNDNPNLHSYSSLDQAGSSSRLIFEVNSGKQLNQKDPSIGSLTELSRRERDRLHSYLGSIDCGTTSSRFLIFDRNGNPVASHQVELNNIYPEPG